jgi:GDP-4-dehydro-6-deoxy-D-mannose reductase
MPKILVTGANGFVGQHLVKELTAHDLDVMAVGGSQAPALADSKGIECIVVDLTNAEEVKKINFEDVNGVVHLAGLAAIAPSFEKPMDYINGNISMEVNIFEAALAQDAKPRFLIISSGTLYDPGAELPLTEDSAVLANSPYAVSKIGQEQMSLYYTTRSFEVIIARPFNHIGPGQGAGFIVPDLAQQIVAAKKGDLEKILVGNLDAQRDYTDVRDIVKAYRLLLENGKSGEVYNICSGQPRTGHEMLEGLQKAAGLEARVEQDPDKMRPSDTPVLYGSHQKLTQDTGWRPEIPLDQTLADVIADWRNRD